MPFFMANPFRLTCAATPPLFLPLSKDAPEAATNGLILFAAKGAYQLAAKTMERTQLILLLSFNLAISTK